MPVPVQHLSNARTKSGDVFKVSSGSNRSSAVAHVSARCSTAVGDFGNNIIMAGLEVAVPVRCEQTQSSNRGSARQKKKKKKKKKKKTDHTTI